MKKILLATVLFFSGAAWADDYVQPTLPNIVKALVRYGAIDPAEDPLLDDYARAAECEIVQYFYRNDFKFEEVRDAIRKNMDDAIATFPQAFYISGPVYLDRYDFRAGIFRLSDRAPIRNTNTFFFAKADVNLCPNLTNNRTDQPEGFAALPKAYRAVTDRPITIEGLYMSPEQSKLLFELMTLQGNTDKKIYVKFLMTLMHADKISLYARSPIPSDYLMEVKLDAVEFYQDAKLTRLISKIVP